MVAEVPGLTGKDHKVNKDGGLVFQSSPQSPEIHSDCTDIGDTMERWNVVTGLS